MRKFRFSALSLSHKKPSFNAGKANPLSFRAGDCGLAMLFEIFGAELQTLYGGVIHPVAVAFQNHGIYADSKRLCHQAVEIHIAGTQLHAVGFQNRRYGAARNAGAAVVDMPQLHAGPQTLHPRKGVGAALGKPVAVKLKVDELRGRFPPAKCRRHAFRR